MIERVEEIQDILILLAREFFHTFRDQSQKLLVIFIAYCANSSLMHLYTFRNLIGNQISIIHTVIKCFCLFVILHVRRFIFVCKLFRFNQPFIRTEFLIGCAGIVDMRSCVVKIHDRCVPVCGRFQIPDSILMFLRVMDILITL